MVRTKWHLRHLCDWNCSDNLFLLVSAKDAAEEEEEEGEGGSRWQGEAASSFWEHLWDEMTWRGKVDFYFRCFSPEGTTQGGPEDHREPESLRWDDSGPRRWRGAHYLQLTGSKVCLVLPALTLWTLLLFQVAFDEATDEFSAYFNKLTNPKVLITTSDRPRGVISFSCNCWDASLGLSVDKSVVSKKDFNVHWTSHSACVQGQHTALFSLRLRFMGGSCWVAFLA